MSDKDSYRQVLEIHHHGEMLVRIAFHGSIEGMQVEGTHVSIIGRPDLTDISIEGMHIKTVETVKRESPA